MQHIIQSSYKKKALGDNTYQILNFVLQGTVLKFMMQYRLL